ncbi:MAG: hypothetical protein HYV29_14250 [Ignavibacteriales bacterium]|nr:hypothetical protein [Ignavibacteriales bacterium]
MPQRYFYNLHRSGTLFRSILLLILFCPLSILSQTNDESTITNILNPFLNIDAGYLIRRNAQSNNEDFSIEYAREDFKVVTLNLNTGMMNQSLLTFNYQRTSPRRTFQQDLLESDINKVQGLERYKFGIILDALMRYLLPEHPLVRTLLSVRFRYIRESSQTNAIVTERFTYLPKNSIINYAARTAENAVALPQWTSYYFKTVYDYYETTVRLPTLLPQYEGTFGGLRIGYAIWEYQRPFSTNVVQINGNPVVYDANPVVKSIVMVFEALDEGSPGLHFDGTLSLGVDNVLKSWLNWNHVAEFQRQNTEVQYSTSRFEINIWYNLYTQPVKAKGVFVTLGGSIHGFNFNIVHVLDVSEKESKVIKRVENSDIFGRLWMTISLRL